MAPLRWTEDEKRQMVTMRAQNQHISWEEFQKTLWPTRTVGALAFMYSELKRLDRLRARAQEQNIPQQPSPAQSLPDQPPPDQTLSNTVKRARETLREDDATCETSNSPAQPSHAAKRPRREDSNGRTEQRMFASPNRGPSSPTDPQMKEASLGRQNSVSTSSTSSTNSTTSPIDHAIQSNPCQPGTQSELTETIQVEEEAANGLPLPCPIKEAVPNETMPSGPTPAQQSEQPNTCHFEEVDPMVLNGIDNEIADLAQRFCDDISVVRKRRPIVQVRQSELSEAFSSLQSSLLDLKHKVDQREEEINKAQNTLKQSQQEMEKRIKEAVEQVIAQKNDEKGRLMRDIQTQQKNTIELIKRNHKLEEENNSLKETLKGIVTAAKQHNST